MKPTGALMVFTALVCLASPACAPAIGAPVGGKDRALADMKAQAARGVAQAQFDLGDRYARGVGVARDDAEAARWLRKAADQGHAGAANDLGALYEDGRGVGKDSAQAVVWYRKAADRGLAAAQNNLGRLYARGEGVGRDFAAARAWFDKAAAQGNPETMNNLARIHGEGDGVRADPIEALTWSYRAQARYQVLGLQEPDYGVRNRTEAVREMTPTQIAEAHRRSIAGLARITQAAWPAWASDADLARLARTGVDPARDLEARGNYHWRWRAHGELKPGRYRCPAGTTVDISRTLILVSAPPGAPCRDGAGGRADALKLAPDGSAEPIG